MSNLYRYLVFHLLLKAMSGKQILRSQVGSSLHTSRITVAPASKRFPAAQLCRHNTSSASTQTKSHDDAEDTKDEEKEKGAMARRLSQMAEDALLEGGSSARRNIEHAGFSEELKQQLEERVKAASFKSENPIAHSILDMPVWPQLDPPLRARRLTCMFAF